MKEGAFAISRRSQEAATRRRRREAGRTGKKATALGPGPPEQENARVGQGARPTRQRLRAGAGPLCSWGRLSPAGDPADAAAARRDESSCLPREGPAEARPVQKRSELARGEEVSLLEVVVSPKSFFLEPADGSSFEHRPSFLTTIRPPRGGAPPGCRAGRVPPSPGGRSPGARRPHPRRCGPQARPCLELDRRTVRRRKCGVKLVRTGDDVSDEAAALRSGNGASALVPLIVSILTAKGSATRLLLRWQPLRRP